MCVDNSRPSLSFLFPLINGLSDHYAQILSKIYMQQIFFQTENQVNKWPNYYELAEY